jgi:leucyl-tRNA synthetase
MSDLGLIQTREPFQKLVNQGLLGAFAYKTPRGVTIPVDDVDEREDGRFVLKASSEHYDPAQPDVHLEKVRAKMSKSLRNVVNPDDVVAEYGADSFRVHLMFMGPVEQPREWETKNVASAHRFLSRFWRFVTAGSPTGHRDTIDEADEDVAVQRVVDQTVRAVGDYIEDMRLNAAIAMFMKCINAVGQSPVSKRSLDKLVRALSPFAPFACEELGQRLGHNASLARAEWPEFDRELIESVEQVEIPITVNGKKRATLEVAPTIEDGALEALVRSTLDGTQWAVSPQAKVLVVRARDSGHPRLVNVVGKK